MAMVILSIDLAKAKSLFCWFNTADQSHRFKTVASAPAAFHEALLAEPVDRVVIEVCDMAGWVQDMCQALSIPIQVANVNVEGWRWKNTKSKTDKNDALKLARLSAGNDLKLVWLPDRTTRHWRATILYRHRLIERRTRIKNSIHALLVAEGRAMKAGKQAFKPASLSKLRELARPMDQCSKQQLWSGHLWMELEQLDELEEQIALLDRKLDGLGDADHRVIRLRTIPGVGAAFERAGGRGAGRSQTLQERSTGRRLCRSGAAALSVGADGSIRADQQGRLRQAEKAAPGDRLGHAQEQPARTEGVRRHQQRTEDPPQAGGGGAGAESSGLVLGDAAGWNGLANAHAGNTDGGDAGDMTE